MIKYSCIKSIASFVCILSLVIQTNASAQGYLKAIGTKIVNDNGPILLRGLNLGNWLVNEGYMMEMQPAADAPHEIKDKLESLIGKENTAHFFEVYRASYVQERDIDTLFKLGFNHVRLPFHYNLLTPEDSPGVYLEKGFAYIDSTISWCKKRNMYVILDMHCVPGAANAAGHGDSHGAADLWNYTKNQDRLCQIWKYIAKKYESEPTVGGYDLVNESVNTDDQPDNKLMRKVFIRVTDSIRTVDKKHIIFIEGNWYGSDFRGLTPTWDNNMVYSFHKYWVPPTTEHLQYLLDIMNEYNVPLWLGESGENSNSWYCDLIKILEENNIGWCWWTYKKPNSITSPFRLVFTPGWIRLKDYWKGAIEKPSTEFITNSLLHFAKSTTLDNCEFNPDVYEAIMRKDYSIKSTPWPFSSNKIPGRLNAIWYDIGRQDVAYKDNVYATNSNNPFLTWNNNWVGRNDGVDMEIQTDSTGVNYTMTGIESNEWVKYTIDASKGGNYFINFRVAAAGNGAIVKVLVDDKNVTTVKLKGTQGGHKWKTVTSDKFFVKEGKHEIKLVFKKGDFNFNYMEFVAE